MRPTRRTLVAGTAALAAVAAFAFFASRPSAAPPPPDDRTDEIAHVHGLGINPANNKLYVATHHGVFVVDERGGARVGEVAQDTMGFTVAGADRFLASGHPDLSYRRPVQGRRPLLGLVESRNAGVSWTELSLGGQADFHALVAAHGQVFGWDATSGSFMVSADGRSWETRSRLGMISFAIDPADPARVLASTESGLLTSGDGGRTWRSGPTEPRNAFLSWTSGKEVWAAMYDTGRVFNSVDGGSAWREVSKLPGPAEALLHHGGTVYAASGGAGIVRSVDGGRTWSFAYRARPRA